MTCLKRLKLGVKIHVLHMPTCLKCLKLGQEDSCLEVPITCLKWLKVGLVDEDSKEVDAELGVVDGAPDEGLGPGEGHLPLYVRVGVDVRRPREHEPLQGGVCTVKNTPVL